jgi:hypothetical protein
MAEAGNIAALRAHWLATWQGSEDVKWDDDVEMGAEGSYWLRVTIRSSGSRRMIVGRRREEQTGTIMVNLYGPREEGPGALERLAEEVAQLWRDFRYPTINTDPPSVVGLNAEGAFNCQLVTLGWRGDNRFA